MTSKYRKMLPVLAAFAFGAIATQALQAQVKPPAYAISEVEIVDQTVYAEFASKVTATYLPFGGKYLVRGGEVVPVDGEAPKRAVVVMFESMEKAKAWRESAAWKELAPLRAKSMKERTYIANGFAG